MKAYRNNLDSLSETDSKYNNEKQDKIHIESCPLKVLKCKEYLSVINKNYIQSEIFRVEKDYQRSIDALKSAFYKTTDLNELTCLRCAEFFRSTIIDSIKNIHIELENLTTGIFSNKHYKSNYILAEKVLMELENHEIYKTFQLNKSKDRFNESYPSKNVI